MSRKALRAENLDAIYSSRRQLLAIGILLMLAILLLRLLFVFIFKSQWLSDRAQKTQQRVLTEPSIRGMITDRHGEPLAISSPTANVSIDVKKFFQLLASQTEQLNKYPVESDTHQKLLQVQQDTEAKIGALAQLLKLEKDQLLGKLEEQKSRRYYILAKNIPPQQAQQIIDLELPTINQERGYARYYPLSESASHIIGFTNSEGVGAEGLERTYNQQLNGAPEKTRVIRDGLKRIIEKVEQVESGEQGENLKVTLDSRIQFVAYKALKNQVYKTGAKAGSIVVLDVNTGELLAIANLPVFNPHDKSKLKAAQYRNRSVADSFEPGSTIKPITVAAALEAHSLNPDVEIDTSPGYIEFGEHRVKDSKNYGSINLETLLARSSNVGAAKVALSMQAQQQWMFLNRIGIGMQTGADLAAENIGKLSYYNDWYPVDRASIGYGYGLSTNLLQLARAYAAFANGGYLLPVRITATQKLMRTRIMSADTARSIRKFLAAVTKDGATGHRASVKGYKVAGKTGTAFKFIKGKYSSTDRIVSFIGFAPVTKPEIVVAVMLDDPKVSKATGGALAAPVFAQVTRESLRLLDIIPDDFDLTPSSGLSEDEIEMEGSR